MPTPPFPLYRYPEDVGTPPFDKWIRFDAKAMRHVLRNKNIGEQNEQDVTLASAVIYLTESNLKSTLSTQWNPQDLQAVGGLMMQELSSGRSAGSVMNQGGAIGLIFKTIGDKLAKLKEMTVAGAATAVAESGYGLVMNELSKASPDIVRWAGEAALGQKVNPRTEILFDSQQYRSWNFEFMMVPRSRQEAENIDNIIRFFQFYMLPKYMENETLMGYPFEFQVGIYSSPQWVESPTSYNWQQLKRVSHMGRSIVKNVTVDHAAGGKTAFVKDNGELFPVATQLSLELQEVKLLDRTDSEIRRGLSEAEMSAAFPDPRKAN